MEIRNPSRFLFYQALLSGPEWFMWGQPRVFCRAQIGCPFQNFLQPRRSNRPLRVMLRRTQLSPIGLLSHPQKADTLIPNHPYV